MQIRLQVILARAGVASRRAAEELIIDGKVSVNGTLVTQLGSKADPERDEIVVSGNKINIRQRNLYLLLNKPGGRITTKDDPEQRPTVMELLAKNLQHLHPIGRLDWATEGALLLTDDGTLTHALTHPRYEIERVYHIKLDGKLSESDAVKWLEGATLEDGLARAESAEIISFTGKHTWLEIMIKEGRNREIRRLAEALGYQVMRLRRYSFAGISIQGVPPEGYRFLEKEEVETLRSLVIRAGASISQNPINTSTVAQNTKRSQREKLSFDLTPKGIQTRPRGKKGMTQIDGFDEEGKRVFVAKPAQTVAENTSKTPHGTQVWISDKAHDVRPKPTRPSQKASSRNPENLSRKRTKKESRQNKEQREKKEARNTKPSEKPKRKFSSDSKRSSERKGETSRTGRKKFRSASNTSENGKKKREERSQNAKNSQPENAKSKRVPTNRPSRTFRPKDKPKDETIAKGGKSRSAKRTPSTFSKTSEANSERNPWKKTTAKTEKSAQETKGTKGREEKKSASRKKSENSSAPEGFWSKIPKRKTKKAPKGKKPIKSKGKS